MGERAGHVLSQVTAGDSGGRFDLPDVNGIGGRVQGSGYDHGFPVIFLGGFLIIEGEGCFRSEIFQNICRCFW